MAEALHGRTQEAGIPQVGEASLSPVLQHSESNQTTREEIDTNYEVGRRLMKMAACSIRSEIHGIL